MDKYIKCLMDINETAKESDIADFEFSESREAIIFSQWMGAILPIDENERFKLPGEIEAPLPSELDSYEEWQPLLSESMVSLDKNYLLNRRYVLFVPPLTDEFTYCQIIGDIVKKEPNPQSFILVECDREKYRKYNEDFWKYIAGCYLRGKGYLVTKRRPYDMQGVPDMGAYKTPSVLNPLRKHKFIKEGCFLVELELPLIFGEATESPAADEMEECSVVVEAKSRSPMKAPEDQLIGYLTHRDNHCYFDKGYITGPDFVSRDKVGIISNRPDGGLLQSERRRKKETPCSLLENKLKALNQAEMLVKLMLAKNLPLSCLLELCRDKPLNEISFRGFLNELSLALKRMTVDELCSLVREEGLNQFGYKYQDEGK